MSDSKNIPLGELNKRLDQLIKEYEHHHNECKAVQRFKDAHIYFGKIEAITDLKIEINEPKTIEDVSENLQQTINVHDANKIAKDEL